MIAQKPGGSNAAAMKYDLLTSIGVVGLSGNPVRQRSMLRLITLITARYNWRTGEMRVGRREIARLWGVDERTVKREMARLRDLGFVVLRRRGVRGRVAAYGVDFNNILSACDAERVGPDFAARVLPASPAADVIPFPQTVQHGEIPTVSPWHGARRRLGTISEAAYGRWIAPLQWAGVRDGRATLLAPSAYLADYVQRTYGDVLLAALQSEDPTIVLLRVVETEAC